MTRLKLLSLLVGVALGFVVGAYGIAYLVAAGGRTAPVAVEEVRSPADAPDAATQIAFWSKRVAERPHAYLDLTLLGQAFARRARETSDVGYYSRADKALREALSINPKYVSAAASLSAVLLALHDFEDAIDVARPIADRPDAVQALATLGDARLALGQYSQAQAAYARLRAGGSSAAVYSRFALLADLRGRTDQAFTFMERAATLAARSGEYGESLAWYAFQLGELSFRAGKIDASASRYHDALAIFPNYPLALAGLAKTKAAQGRYPEAIRLYERAVAAVPQPEWLAALGDVYTAGGNRVEALEQYGTLQVVAKLQRANRQILNRQLAIFYADHGIRLAEARRLALAELRVRKDIHGYDTAAWALARSGRCARALPLAMRSLRLGTKDALLYFHRGYAEGCAGNRGAMRAWYAKALELSPAFSVRWAAFARAALSGG